MQSGKVAFGRREIDSFGKLAFQEVEEVLTGLYLLGENWHARFFLALFEV